MGGEISASGQTGHSEAIHCPELWASMGSDTQSALAVDRGRLDESDPTPENSSDELESARQRSVTERRGGCFVAGKAQPGAQCLFRVDKLPLCLGKASARASIEALDLRIDVSLRGRFEAQRAQRRALNRNPVSESAIGVGGHQILERLAGALMLIERDQSGVESLRRLPPRLRLLHVDDRKHWRRGRVRMQKEEARSLAALD